MAAKEPKALPHWQVWSTGVPCPEDRVSLFPSNAIHALQTNHCMQRSHAHDGAAKSVRHLACHELLYQRVRLPDPTCLRDGSECCIIASIHWLQETNRLFHEIQELCIHALLSVQKVPIWHSCPRPHPVWLPLSHPASVSVPPSIIPLQPYPTFLNEAYIFPTLPSIPLQPRPLFLPPMLGPLYHPSSLLTLARPAPPHTKSPHPTLHRTARPPRRDDPPYLLYFHVACDCRTRHAPLRS